MAPTTRSSRSSRCALELLSPELFLIIAEFADFDTRLALSATNSHCRNLLLPTVFRALKLTSDETEANEVLAIAKKIGGNVQALSFHGTGHPKPNEDGAQTEDEPVQVLPLAAAELLRGQHLPNMNSLIVHFTFDFDGRDDGIWDSRDDLSEGASIYVFTVEETSKDMIDESEREFSWRRLMAQTWAMASENTNITSLTVKDLIPKALSSWFTPQWEQFLSQIKTCNISIWGGDNGAGWECGTLNGYMYFVQQMDSYFFRHLKNTTKARVSCYEHGPYGSDWTSQPTLDGPEDTMALRTDCFARLQDLYLEYAVICPQLMEFLVSKHETLKTVTLHECFASQEYPDVRLTWADFFVAIRKSNPKWTSFEITNDNTPPLTFREWQSNKYKEEMEDKPDEDETEEVARIRADLAEHPEKRLFLYATLTDKYGDRWPSEECIMEQFDAGKDMLEFEALMDVVRANKDKEPKSVAR